MTLVACSSHDVPDRADDAGRPLADARAEVDGAMSGASDGAAGDAGGSVACEPPHAMMVGAECVPSCGAAGGNQCVPRESTLCEGLPLLRSYDCAVCCARPSYPGPVGARSFHFVYEGDEPYWDSILELGATNPAIAYVARDRPDEIAPERWVKSQHTSYHATGTDMARAINAILVDPATAPIMVMVDELNESSIDYVAELASVMRTRYPQWEGRWGAFSTVFTGGQPAIDELLEAHAHIAAERYIGRDWYCEQGDNAGERDIALATFFDGSPTLARFDWLVARRAHFGSRSPLTTLFGVTDRWMTGASPAVYLDRMFYVWVTRTRHPGAISIDSGGPGAWKWTPRHVEGGFGTTNTSRDLAFAESVRWYSIEGNRTSRLGQVPCP
jgi:hypothetical protein